MECGDVPGDLWRHVRNELRQLSEFVIGVVKAADQQSDNLQPNLMRMQPTNRVEDRPDAASELAIMPVVETLEINFVKINPRPDVFKHLRCSISVRNKCCFQSGSFGSFKNFNRPFRC